MRPKNVAWIHALLSNCWSFVWIFRYQHYMDCQSFQVIHINKKHSQFTRNVTAFVHSVFLNEIGTCSVNGCIFTVLFFCDVIFKLFFRWIGLTIGIFPHSLLEWISKHLKSIYCVFVCVCGFQKMSAKSQKNHQTNPKPMRSRLELIRGMHNQYISNRLTAPFGFSVQIVFNVDSKYLNWPKSDAFDKTQLIQRCTYTN